MVVVPGGDGDIGVLPGHSLLIGTVRPGVIDIHEGGKVKEKIFVAGGFAEVTPERCTVLAEEAMPLSDLTVELADARQKQADEDDDDQGRKVAEAMRVALAH